MSLTNLVPFKPQGPPWGLNGTKFVRDISWRLQGRFSWFKSHMKALWPKMHLALFIFPQASRGCMGPKSFLGFHICQRILSWFLRLWYIEVIWWHSTLGLFSTPLLTWYVDSLVNLIMQCSLLGHQASCLEEVFPVWSWRFYFTRKGMPPTWGQLWVWWRGIF